MRGAFIFLARRPGGGITELRTHEQGCVGVGAIGVQMVYLTPIYAGTVSENPPRPTTIR